LNLEGKQVDVLDYQPGGIYTGMAMGRTGFFMSTPQSAAEFSLDELGQQPICVGTFNHLVYRHLRDCISDRAAFDKIKSMK